MIKELPLHDLPNWLNDLTVSDIKSGAFPLLDVLRDSLYYPASAFDGDPIAYLGGNFHTFIYVDYGHTQEDLYADVHERGLLGYNLMAERSVNVEKLCPNGWGAATSGVRVPRIRMRNANWKKPFCNWMVFQRAPAYSEDHGPLRLSLLFLCADGAAAYDALYRTNNMHAKAIAVIQPGHAFGGNWTNFTDPDAVLADIVLQNPNGKPEYLLYGGSGGAGSYQTPCWPEYSQNLCFLGNTSIGVWQR